MAETLDLNEENLQKEIEKIRPHLQQDGGDIELVGLEDKTAKVRLKGACAGCAFAMLTLQYSVEKNLKEVFPDLEKVENVE